MTYNSLHPRSSDYRGRPLRTRLPPASEELKALIAERAYLLNMAHSKTQCIELTQNAWEIILRGAYGLPLSKGDIEAATECLVQVRKQLSDL
jgi:hypothetical protein